MKKIETESMQCNALEHSAEVRFIDEGPSSNRGHAQGAGS